MTIERSGAMTMHWLTLLAAGAALAWAVGACSGDETEEGPGPVGGTTAVGAGGAGAGSTATGGTGAGSNSDDDMDGYTPAEGDCDDDDYNVNPGEEEVCDDGIDNDCDGAKDDSEADGDGDGYGPCMGDCDDDDPEVHPAADEVDGDGVDNNCDGYTDEDIDGDGVTAANGDCDDHDPTSYPGAEEHCYDGVDNDCNTFTDSEEPDADGDGFGPCSGDCAEGDASIGPNQPEVDGDGIDNNCDNLIDEDIDGDGWTSANGDCDDGDPTRNPAVIEDCGDGIDNNCNTVTDTDCLTPCDIAAASRSSVGCVYYAVDTNPIHSFVAGTYAVAISNVDTAQTANVVIEQKSGTTWSVVSGGSFSVAPLSLQTRVLPHRYISGSEIYAGGAYRITSDLPVIAYQFNPLDGSSSYLSDASLLLPASAFDTYYIVPAWPYGPADGSISSGWPAHIQIAASSDTQVRVTSPITTVAGTGVPSLTPNVQASFNLTEGDYLQLTVLNFMDSFNGTYIESDQPVAVFTSNDCANVPTGGPYCCCEHLEEQVFGLQTWGTSYVAARVPRRSTEFAVWQIMAQEDTTTVSFDYNAQVTGLPANVTLNARQMVEYQVNGSASHPGDFFISADKPILVTQYMVASAFAGGSNGDPSMIQAVPVEQFLDQYVVLVPSTWINDFLVLVREQGQTVSIDGNPVSSGWVPTGASNYEVARLSVPDGVHVLDGSAPFGVIVIGYDSYDSYGYPGGLNQSIINPIN
ncbi:MAG: hypothetical protein JRI23_21205 [Deltaproteobacteria bacterium]|jgi:hypothetical protein|nr:hypothetical protein [Deltaproteobacteria bacterium]MBW2534457.1 hypothetical protein [Deltaproteobacteria bacterium]